VICVVLKVIQVHVIEFAVHGIDFKLSVLLYQFVDLELSFFKAFLTAAGQRHATFEVFQGLVEGLLTLLHSFHNFFKLGKRFLKI